MTTEQRAYLPEFMADLAAQCGTPVHKSLINPVRSFPVMLLPGRPAFMLDRDVARAYGVATMDLNRARKRNPKKFNKTIDFFKLSKTDMTKCHIDKDKGGHRPVGYSKKGCYMFATILQTDAAIEQAVRIVEGFMRFEQGQVKKTAPAIEHPPRPAAIAQAREQGLKAGLVITGICARFGISMAKLNRLCELRRMGLTQRQAAGALDLSRDQAQRLEKQLKTVGVTFERASVKRTEAEAISALPQILFGPGRQICMG